METDSPSEPQWSNVITSTNHGALVSIIAWLMVVGSWMFLGIRMSIRLPWRKLLGFDDYMTMVATVFATAHTVAILLAVKYGLGRHAADIEENEGYRSLQRMSLVIYIGEVFVALGVTCSKLAVSLLFIRLASGKWRILPAKILSGIILACGIASVIAVAASSPFIRGYPKATGVYWPDTWMAVAAMNLALEAGLFVYPFYLVWDLQMPLKSKFTVIVGFCLRLPCSAIALLRIVALQRVVNVSIIDLSWNYVRPAIYTEVELHYSLIAATIPCTHIFLRHLSTGYLSTTADQYGAESSRKGTNDDSYAMSTAPASRGRATYAKQSVDAAANDFDFGDAFEKSSPVEQKTTPAKHLSSHDVEGLGVRPKSKEVVVVTDGGWEMRPSGCGGSTTTKIAHSIHASDGSVTSDGSDRIIIKKTVDVRYGSTAS